MEEIVDLYDKTGKIIGKISKSEAHRTGALHRSIHVWIINDSNEILLQYRSPEKDLCPNTWDCSYGGHIDVGENSIDTLIREGKEELGVDIDMSKLEFLVTTREYISQNGVINNDFSDVYVLRQNIKLENLLLQTDEVSNVKYVSVTEFLTMKKQGQLLPHDNVEYFALSQYIERNLIKNKKNPDVPTAPAFDEK